MTSNRPPLDLGAMGGTPEEVLERMLALTDTFSKMMGKEFDLVDAPSGSTDCESFFRVPLVDPEAYLILEHEISHPFFGTDLALTEAFRDKAVERLLQRAGIPKTHPDAIPYKGKLEGLVHHLWNVLEDWRCRSLWGELYFGGAEMLRQRWEDIARHEMEDQAEKDLITYLGRIAAGVDTDGAPDEFKACAKHMKKARSRVERVDNKACLALTARLIDDIADELLSQFPPEKARQNSPQSQSSPKQQQAQQKLNALNRAISDPGDKGKGHGDSDGNPLGGKDLLHPTGGNGQTKKKRVTAKQMGQIRRLLTAKDDDFEVDEDGEATKASTLQKMLDDGADKMFQTIQIAKQELGKAKKSRKKSMEDILLDAAKVSGIRGVLVTPSQKLPRASRSASRMRRHLEQVRMKKETKRVWYGQDLNIEAMISAKISGALANTKLFNETRKYGGMDLLLLLDVSGSMCGYGIDLLERAVADIDFAARGVNVRLHMWGFSSELYFFKKIGSPKSVPGIVMMMTSMVQALDAAWEWAKTAKADRAVLMLTDGFPTSCRGRKSTGNPVEDLHAVLRGMRLDGVVVSVLGIGAANQTYYDQAFGPKKYGLVSSMQDLPKALEDAARVMIEAHIG